MNTQNRQAEQMGEIAVWGESQVGKTCFVEKVRIRYFS
jgi:GTPase SAR1 family protein